MKNILLILLLTGLCFNAVAQSAAVENPLIDHYKQTVTIYADSAFKAPKIVSTDFLRFRLLEWKNGGWKAEKRGLSNQKVDTVYVKDDQFLKTPEYRKVLEAYDPAFKAKHQAYYSKLVKRYGRKLAGGIYNGVPVIGMTERQFFMCMDRPSERNTTTLSGSRSEQLVYKNGDSYKYYYFTDGKLTAIQN